MKEYLRKNGIRLAVIVTALVLVIAVAAGTGYGHAGFLTDAVGRVREPVRKAAASVAEWITSISGYFGQYEELQAENERLKAELVEAQERAQTYAEEARENSRLRQALGLAERGADYTLESAKIVTWSASNWSSSFTISKGSSDGIEYGDCVITEYGAVVGTVTEVGRGWATVTTVIDAAGSIGALVGVDRYAAVLEGDFTLMRNGQACITGFTSGAAPEVGDEVLTSGSGGSVPQGANIGTVTEVSENRDGSATVVVTPAADFDSLSQVFIIEEFTVAE